MLKRYYKEELRSGIENEPADLELIKKCKSNEVIISRSIMTEKFIALGRSQYLKDDLKIKTVRKVTDGTAVIFTGNELVYSIVFGSVASSLMSVTSVQKTVMKNLIGMIDSRLVLVEKGSKHSHRPFGCFNATVRNEVVFDERKLIGSSFTRVGDKIFGHIMMYSDTSYQEMYKYFPKRYNDEVDPISLIEIGIDSEVVASNIREGLLNEQYS